MNISTKTFIIEHADDDVRKLALHAHHDSDVDVPFALNQISGRQTARHKLPSWAAVADILYPPHLSMEQCSSEQTARYKAAVAVRLMHHQSGASEEASPSSFLDITGGFGVDFSFIAREFRSSVYVERQEHLCASARVNFPLLGIKEASVVCGNGVEYLHSVSRVGMIYVDPARRNDAGARTFAISDCTPDLLAIEDELTAKADFVMVKLSPMLDWHKTVDDINRSSSAGGDGTRRNIVKEIHIVSVKNECKELLLVLSRQDASHIHVYCVNDDDVFDYEADAFRPAVNACSDVHAGSYLYEPNASIMKAGCFDVLAERYGLAKIEKNSHLFVSDVPVRDFPGRMFMIEKVSTANKKDLKRNLAGMEQANITVRNFPLSVAELRKRLKLRDGGDAYIFATTMRDGAHILLICKRN